MRLMKRALIVFAAWSAVALLFSIQMRFQSTGVEPRSWSWILAWQFTGWWTWALFTVPVCAFAARAARIRRQWVLVAAHLPMAVLVAGGCAGFEGGLKWALGLWRTPHTLGSGVADGISIWWTFNVLVYAMVAGLYYAWRAARLETQLVQARLDALVGQLQPHFLFNTLHTISIWWTFNVLVYAMVAGLYYAWRAARLETQLVQARLDALVGQLQPHFLFNTL